MENKKKNYFSFSASYGFGNTIKTNPFVKGDNLKGEPLNHYQLFSIKALWQNPGITNWQKVYRGPYYGFGVSMGDFFNKEEVGYPISYFGILGIPILRKKKLELYSEFQFGMTSNWTHYDSITNPKNIVIGGGLTVHLNIGVNAYYPITKHIDLGAGVAFIHYSNGGMERPNRGFNVYTPSAELKYHFGGRPGTREIKSSGRIERSNDFYIMLGYGNHQLVEHELDSNYFAIGGLSLIYFQQLSNAFRLGTGTDINYWWGLNAKPDGTIGPRTLDNFTIGLILQPELIIDKLTLVGGFGIYARHLHYNSFKQMYQRLGVRYDVYKNWSVGVNVRAVNFMLAEFMEFNMGYRFRWIK
jgi:opacity protein-like surface antigen